MGNEMNEKRQVDKSNVHIVNPNCISVSFEEEEYKDAFVLSFANVDKGSIINVDTDILLTRDGYMHVLMKMIETAINYSNAKSDNMIEEMFSLMEEGE